MRIVQLAHSRDMPGFRKSGHILCYTFLRFPNVTFLLWSAFYNIELSCLNEYIVLALNIGQNPSIITVCMFSAKFFAPHACTRVKPSVFSVVIGTKITISRDLGI